MKNRRFILGLSLLASLSAGGCSTVLEATRPDPVDLGEFKRGEARLEVVGEVGAPLSSVKDQDKSCDVYQLYTRGPGAWGKAGIALVEAGADVLTLGLAEIVETPAEAATRNSLHTVLFCYTADDKLALVRESEAHVDSQPVQASGPVLTEPPPVALPSTPAQAATATAQTSQRPCTQDEATQKRIAIRNGYTVIPNCQ